jgi:hypothetical protein
MGDRFVLVRVDSTKGRQAAGRRTIGNTGGMDRHDALKLAIRCARDSMPPLRLAIIDDLAANPDSTLAEVRKRLNKPRATVDRELQALHMLGVLDCDEREEVTKRTGNEVTRWHYSLTDGIESTAINPAKLPIKSVPTPRPQEERDLGDDASRLVSDKAGNFAPSGDDPPAAPLLRRNLRHPRQAREGCTTGLYADDSQQLGYCTKCRRAQERTSAA